MRTESMSGLFSRSKGELGTSLRTAERDVVEVELRRIGGTYLGAFVKNI
jgi:hypothetical protein